MGPIALGRLDGRALLGGRVGLLEALSRRGRTVFGVLGSERPSEQDANGGLERAAASEEIDRAMKIDV